jgi:hypothetical protein
LHQVHEASDGFGFGRVVGIARADEVIE